MLFVPGSMNYFCSTDGLTGTSVGLNIYVNVFDHIDCYLFQDFSVNPCMWPFIVFFIDMFGLTIEAIVR